MNLEESKPNNEKIEITSEDRKKVSEITEKAIEHLGKPMRYKSFVMSEIRWRDALTKDVGEEKARVLMDEIKEKAREIRSKIPKEELPKSFKAVMMERMKGQKKKEDEGKIEEIRNKILEEGVDKN